MQKMILCIGMISSGKSTYAKNLVKQMGYISCCDDDVLNLVTAGQYLYRKEIKSLLKTLENAVVSNALLGGFNVVIDSARNVSIAKRSRFIQWAKSFDIGVEAVVFPKESNEIHAKRRTEHDNRGLPYDFWLDVANEHDKIYGEPEEVEGFDAIHYICWKEVQSGKVFS